MSQFDENYKNYLEIFINRYGTQQRDCCWLLLSLFSPVGKCISEHPVLKWRILSKYPFGQSCILERIASPLRAMIIFSYMLYNGIFKSAPVANTVGVKYECLAVFYAKALTFFLLFFVQVCSLWVLFWSVVLWGYAGSCSGEMVMH